MNYLIGLLLSREGAPAEALAYAERIIKTFPEIPEGYLLKGELLSELRLFDEAIAAYAVALRRSTYEGRRPIYWKIGRAYFEQERYARAYRFLVRGIDILSPDASLEDLYTLSIAAVRAGKAKEAESLLVYLAEYRVPSDDDTWRQKIKAALTPYLRGQKESGKGGGT